MKTEAIKQSIVSNYKILAEKSHVKSNQGDIVTTWGLNYNLNNKPFGFVNELGEVETKKAKIQIKNDEINKINKPFFSTWKRTLKTMNTMLENIISNYDNPEIVRQSYVNILCFKKELLERLTGVSKNIK